MQIHKLDPNNDEVKFPPYRVTIRINHPDAPTDPPSHLNLQRIKPNLYQLERPNPDPQPGGISNQLYESDLRHSLLLGDSGLGVFHFPFEIGEFLVENGEPGPAGHVERVEEVGDPLDGRRDHFDVFAIRPILRRKFPMEMSATIH